MNPKSNHANCQGAQTRFSQFVHPKRILRLLFPQAPRKQANLISYFRFYDMIIVSNNGMLRRSRENHALACRAVKKERLL